MQACLLDTDILSEVLKAVDQNVLANVARYLTFHSNVRFSCVTRYEIQRGYKSAQGIRQLGMFDHFCRKSQVLELSEKIFDRAADIWVIVRHCGFPRGDADIMIAATALEHGRELVTGNTSHFAWIPGLTLADWRLP